LDLLQAGDNWLTLRTEAVLTEDTISIKGVEIQRSIDPLYVLKQINEQAKYEANMKDITNIKTIIPVNREPDEIDYPMWYLPTNFVSNQLTAFKETYLPQVLGGNSTIHPLDYITTELSIKNRLESWQFRRQKIHITKLKDQPTYERIENKILKSGFVESSALVFDYTAYGTTSTQITDTWMRLATLWQTKIRVTSDMWFKTWADLNSGTKKMIERQVETDMASQSWQRRDSRGRSMSPSPQGPRLGYYESMKMTYPIMDLQAISAESIATILSGSFKTLDITMMVRLYTGISNLSRNLSGSILESVITSMNVCMKGINSQVKKFVNQNAPIYQPGLLTAQLGRLGLSAISTVVNRDSKGKVWNWYHKDEQGQPLDIICTTKSRHVLSLCYKTEPKGGGFCDGGAL
jgi:hypothetical protein